MIINISFLLPPVDPPADCGRTNTSISCDSSGGLPPNPQGHKFAAFGECGWLIGISLHHSQNTSTGIAVPWMVVGNLGWSGCAALRGKEFMHDIWRQKFKFDCAKWMFFKHFFKSKNHHLKCSVCEKLTSSSGNSGSLRIYTLCLQLTQLHFPSFSCIPHVWNMWNVNVLQLACPHIGSFVSSFYSLPPPPPPCLQEYRGFSLNFIKQTSSSLLPGWRSKCDLAFDL